jgi:ubiquinol-cytochrome c reductase cytochrome b subunit
VDETRWSSILGASVVAAFIVLALTGVALMTVYAPSPQSAWASVHYLQYVLGGGWLVRGTHWWAAQALVLLAALHIAYGAFAGTYRRPRQVSWWLSLLVLALGVGEGITGGLLPWDQHGWWGRVIEGNIVGLAPVLGGWLQQMVWGGTELGALGLARAHTMHVIVLPIALAIALRARYSMTRSVGPSGGATAAGWRQGSLARDAVVAAVIIVVLTVLACVSHGPALDAPADPMSDYPARPEWFLLTLFALRKFFHGAGEFWGTALVPAAAAAYLALLPWFDVPGPGHPRRSRVMAPVLVIFAGALGLGFVAWLKDARDPQFRKQHAKADARAAAAVKLAMSGVPPAGALEMVRQDPELRGRELFEQHCAGCHVLGELGDPKKATAAKLDGWGTPTWIADMTHDPDAPQFFGRGPYKGEMPSVDVRPKDKPANKPWKPLVKDETEKRAVAVFLASQGDEAGDPPRAVDDATRAAGEKVVTERCSTCHLYKGQGDDEGSGIAPEFSGYGSLSWTRSQIANPATAATYREDALDESRKKHMPRFDADLSASDIDVLARWTRSHARGLPLP